MSYVCQCCNTPVPHRQPMRRHVVYRPNGQIDSETPVCGDCHGWLRVAPWPEVVRQRRKAIVQVVAAMPRQEKPRPKAEGRPKPLAALPPVAPPAPPPLRLPGQRIRLGNQEFGK